MSDVKIFLEENGYRLCGDEPLKITVNTSDFGKSGFELAENLRKNNAECEFCDRDFVVMMVTPENSDRDLEAVKRAFVSHEKTDGKSVAPKTALPVFVLPEKRLSVRQAVFAAVNQYLSKTASEELPHRLPSPVRRLSPWL